MDIRNAVGRFEMFRNLPKSALDRIATVAFHRQLPKGEVLFAQNQPGTAFFFLVIGAMKLYRAEDGREVIIRMVRPGEMFGEAVLFGVGEYPVYAQAVQPSVVVGVPRAPLLTLLDDHDFRTDFIAAVISRLRYLVDHIHVLSIVNLEDRFFRYLEIRHGRQQRYDLGLSKKDVASALGVTPEAFSRLLTRLKKRGVAEWTGPTLRLDVSTWDER